MGSERYLFKIIFHNIRDKCVKASAKLLEFRQGSKFDSLKNIKTYRKQLIYSFAIGKPNIYLL